MAGTSPPVLIDLDDFKAVNDHGGHEVGDRMLVEVAQAIRSRVRLSDHVYRIGGDEFAVLVPHGAEDSLAPLVESLREAIEQLVVADADTTYSAGSSIGVSTINAGTATSAMGEAEAALYRDNARRRS